MTRIKATAGGLAVSTLLIVSAAQPAAAQSPEEFYKGKTITIVLGHPPGGSYDLYARLAADHMKRFIPGNPNIIVQHRPGGGGVAAVRWFHAQAPRDGSTMGLFTETIGHTQLLTPEQGKWKVEEMTYIGTFAPSNAAFVIRKNAAAITAAAMRKTSVTVACTGVNSQSYQYPASLKELGGFKFIIVCGYPGSAEVMLAIHRAEADMFSGSWHVWRATQQAGLKDGSLIPVIQGGLKRTRDLPKVPLMQELVSDARTKKIIEFISAGSAIGRALIAPPGVPADRIAALRTAFDKVVQDKAFLADAAKRSADIEAVPGAEVQGYSDA
ncbi:MAG TPA: tripartite tricarboxylate transporter substrate-binding protein, partial [Xanthobacteraceae bacterium]|nr:tripartite tricarboxylate transporter substrate-binding protein [Xanthobacteraceae bacterium]